MVLTKINAQQTPVFTEYSFNPFLINPAYAGTSEEWEGSLAHSGFSGSFEGVPQTLSLNLSNSLDRGKMALGGGIIHDNIGVNKTTQVFGAYSYKIFFDLKNDRPYWQIFNRTVLSFGITAGVLMHNEDLVSLGIQNDPNFSENISATLPSIGLGFLFGHANFFAGISAPNILSDQFSNQDNLKLSRPIYGYTGYHFFTNKFQEFALKPSVLFKYEKGAPFQVDVNMAMSYKNKFEIGGGYRTNSSYNLLAGLYFMKNFRIMYHHTILSGDAPLGSYNGLMLSYRAGKGYAWD
jgi:type IX secretion system PorP/SprF family membrane protein